MCSSSAGPPPSKLFMGPSCIEIRPNLAHQRSALGRGQQWRRSVDMMVRSLVPLRLVDSISYNALLASYLVKQRCECWVVGVLGYKVHLVIERQK
jgi:hypothetical protein